MSQMPDQGLANENFPKHTGGAIVLDAIGYVDRYMAEKPEEFLEYSDWMGIPIQEFPVTLDRFKSLLMYLLNKWGHDLYCCTFWIPAFAGMTATYLPSSFRRMPESRAITPIY